jgi:hypothetical protein
MGPQVPCALVSFPFLATASLEPLVEHIDMLFPTILYMQSIPEWQPIDSPPTLDHVELDVHALEYIYPGMCAHRVKK